MGTVSGQQGWHVRERDHPLQGATQWTGVLQGQDWGKVVPACGFSEMLWCLKMASFSRDSCVCMLFSAEIVTSYLPSCVFVRFRVMQCYFVLGWDLLIDAFVLWTILEELFWRGWLYCVWCLEEERGDSDPDSEVQMCRMVFIIKSHCFWEMKLRISEKGARSIKRCAQC